MAEQTISIQPDRPCALNRDNQNDQGFSKITPYVHTDETGLRHLSLIVEGIYCAGCIHKIETTLHKLSFVQKARLNFSTRRLNIDWTGDVGFADRITKSIEKLGYKATPFDSQTLVRNEDKEAKFLLLCLGIAGFAAGNIMLVSFALWTTDVETMGIPVRDFLHWISALIAVPAIAYAGRPFFLSAFKALKSRRTNMDVPISVGLILTTGMSLFELATHGEHAYFDSAVMLMFFLLIGRYLDYLARASARRAAGNLLSLMAGTAISVNDGHPQSILIKDLKKDMILSIAMGEHIPADGIILEGNTEIDSSLVTGESLPVSARKGDEVLSGMLNISSPIMMKVLRDPEDSQIGSMVRLMEKAEQSQAQYVRIADRAARLYTPVVHVLALLAFLGWLFVGHLAWQESLLIAATVLIITCPCALALAVPIVQVIAVSRLMKQGVMVRSGDALERLASIDTVILDKTGTLTQGKPVLVNAGNIPAHLLRLAASMAMHSRHPLSKAIIQSYNGDFMPIAIEEIPGKGLKAMIDGQDIRLGKRSWALSRNAPDQPDTMEIVLSIDGRHQASFLFRDELREDAANVIEKIKNKDLDLYLLSGDRNDIVAAIAKKLDIQNFQGDMTPEQKFSFMESLRKQGHKVMMIGDGINDAPVLAGADVSVSPASGMDIARNASSVVFTGDYLAPVIRLIETARFSQSLVRQNFAMTILYNVLAIPLAIAGYVTPLVAAIAMSVSSLAVIFNAFRLRRLP